MTRDSNGWYWIIAGAILTSLASHLSLVDQLLPLNWHETAHALIDLASVVTAAVAGIARMSPLPISPEGRSAAVQKNAEQADAATTKVVEASKAMDKAAAATDAAADKAQEAKEAVNKVP